MKKKEKIDVIITHQQIKSLLIGINMYIKKKIKLFVYKFETFYNK